MPTHRSIVSSLLACGALLVTGCSEEAAKATFTTGGADIPAEIGKTHTFGFDGATTGTLPADFISVLGDWKVASDSKAPSSPNVLRQSAELSNPEYPRVVLKDLTFTNLTVRVRCRMETGETDQACGLMFRLKDSDNYFITRANVLENNVRLYRVVNGTREQFASADVTITANEWHALEAHATGDALSVSWNGTQVITAKDATFDRGKIGLWTKADSVTAFDDLEATAE